MDPSAERSVERAQRLATRRLTQTRGEIAQWHAQDAADQLQADGDSRLDNPARALGPARPGACRRAGAAPPSARLVLSSALSVRWRTDAARRVRQHSRMPFTPPAPPLPLSGTPLFTPDASQLALHLGHCLQACGPLHRVRGAVERVDAFLSSRIVSTLVVLVMVLAASVGAIGWLVD